MDSRSLLLYMTIIHQFDWNKTFEAIRNKEKVNDNSFKEIMDKNYGDFITILDADYPAILKQLTDPPLVIFYRGDLSILSKSDSKYLAVVGSRKPTNYAMRNVFKIVTELPTNIIVVSGLAKGIDSVGHRAAITSGKKTIAVLGCGVDYIYPEENNELYHSILDEGGLIISEYPLNTEPTADFFLRRNKIIAGLCNVLFIGESYARSGSMSTVATALYYGKDIGALPFEAGKNSNCNKLIKDGAYLIEDANDLLNLL